MILDVGCGDDPQGDVNLDLGRITQPIRHNHTVSETKANVIGSGEWMPFRNNVFEKVIADHVIEHVKNPQLFLTELLRVTKKDVLIRCPHRFSRNAKSKVHTQYLTRTWFNEILNSMRDIRRFEISVTYVVFPSFLPMGLSRIDEIVVSIVKR